MEVTLHWHLHDNHFPSISDDFIPVAQEAIERANDGDWDSPITMPNGVTLTVGEIVDGMHLDFFIDQEEED